MNEIFKIMLLGDTGTCKTSFLTQLIDQIPERLPKLTNQLSFFTMRISNPSAIIQLWDSPGDPKFHYQSISNLNHFRSVLMFIDITNEHTYQRARAIIDCKYA
eukprot:GHVR01023472.1.p1 GENE.GHVR01023472.1~~GHVR01023472.1.p1  ORF type:complete len:103 (-),score=4.87 GHVR01023472.1:1481-1789(-)